MLQVESVRILAVPVGEPLNASRVHSHGETNQRNSAVSKQQDPFSYFSNDDVRMAYLIDGEEEATAVNEAIAVTSSSQERRARISFEVSPSVVMEKLMLQEDGVLADDEEADESMDLEQLQDSILEVLSTVPRRRSKSPTSVRSVDDSTSLQEPQASIDSVIESLEAASMSAFSNMSLVELDSDLDDTDSHDESPRPQAPTSAEDKYEESSCYQERKDRKRQSATRRVHGRGGRGL